MTDLIAELENAAEGSRELDGEIHFSPGSDLRWLEPEIREYAKRRNISLTEANSLNSGPEIPHYTTSLDAARSLSNWVLVYASDVGADGLALVRLADTGSPVKEVEGIHNRLEMAWCIAALKARQADDT